jgi:hypothetical protein
VILKKILGKQKVDYAGASRNDPCPCGSGKKFKSCCHDKVKAKEREQGNAHLFHNPKG